MDLLLHSIQLDWPVLLPIFLCSIATVAVAIDRIAFYKANKELDISIIALVENKGKHYIVSFPAIWLLSNDLSYYGLKGGLRLDLRPLCFEGNEVKE